MQPIVYSVFVVVATVIALLLVLGLTGIIAMLLRDQMPGSQLNAEAAEPIVP